jgi:DUF4097 and DUF4098 domain-containing protein YvlB
MSRHAVWAAIGALGVAVLAACGSPAPVIGPVSSTPSSYSVPEQVTKLVLDAPAGNVDITGTDGATSSVQETLRYSGDRMPQAHHDLSHGTLRLGYSCPSGSHDCDIDYRISVPRAARVVVREQAGRVNINNVDGALSVDTQAAEVTGTGLRADTATVTSQAGAVTLTFLSAPNRVDVRTEVGAVRVILPKGDPYAVDASTTVGATEVSVPVDPNAPRHITVQTTTGTASVVPA